MNNAVGFILENSEAPNIIRVSGVNLACTDIASELVSSSEKLTSVQFELSASLIVSLSELTKILIPMPEAICANRMPTEPVPTIPKVLPASCVS